MTNVQRFLPSTRSVVVVVPAGSQLIGVVGLLESFDAANRFLASRGRPPLYALQVAGVRAETASVAGPSLLTQPMADIEDVHTLVVAGSLTSTDTESPPRLLAEVDRLAQRAERVVGVCMGAFVLAELGWLDERRCTTHWMGLDALRARFPRARVQADALYTEDDGVYTSAGATAGIDLALHLIRQDGGSKLALAVARGMVMFAQRPGGQSQFSTALRLPAGLDDRLRRLASQVVAEPEGDHRVERLAERVAMSPRNFARVFREQTGHTPAAFVARVRVEAAQRALVQSESSVVEVAESCGFSSVETLRRTFLRIAGVSPTAYRERFRV